jgi:glycosyltransferase involved in cell wall biosynthesis
MRILFIHATDNRLTPEYKVHKMLADSTGHFEIESFFIWQASTPTPNSPPNTKETKNTYYYDFGREMSIRPQPNRYRRASMILKKFPGALRSSITRTRQIKPDLIYTSQQTLDIRIARIISRISGTPHVIHIHYNVGPWLGKYALKSIRKTPHLIAISEFIRQTALLQGVSPANIQTIINTIPPNDLQFTTDRHIMRANFNWREDNPVVVAVGRLDPGKGHALLIEAFAKVIERIPEARLLICGESSTRDGYDHKLKQRVTELRLDPFIVFAGYRNDISTIMQNADVFCLPTELEPFGLVYLEAMAAGLPVVACYSGAVPEIVVHGITGLLSYPGNPGALADNLLKVLVDRDLASRLGYAARERVYTEFATDKVAEQWSEWLRHITI